MRDVDGHLALARFPSRRDHTSVVLWEAVALTLAVHAGINVPRWRLADVARRKHRRNPLRLDLRRLQGADAKTGRIPMDRVGSGAGEGLVYASRRLGAVLGGLSPY